MSDTFSSLRTFLKGYRSQSGASYRVCIVAYSDARNRQGRQYSGSTVGYVDQVFESWRPRLDPKHHVVIAIAIKNRGIAIHPGSLWAGLGFEMSSITQVIDRSAFGSYARSGDYASALRKLIEAVDLHLALLANQERRRQEKLLALRRAAPDKIKAALANIEALEGKLADAPFPKARYVEDLARQRELFDRATIRLEGGDTLQAAREADQITESVGLIETLVDRAAEMFERSAALLDE
ncbi:MAG: TPM domain-containing protein, partial [Planctomycetota bacterium]